MIEFKGRRPIATGSVAVDTLANLSADGGEDRSLTSYFSGSNSDLSVSLLVENVRKYRGGTGANIARTMGLLGVKPVLLASVGREDGTYLRELEELGVVIDSVFVSELVTAQFSVVTDKRNNQVANFAAEAMKDPKAELSLSKWADEPAFVIVSAHDPEKMRKQIRECVKLGIPYCFDVGQQVNNSSADFLVEGVVDAEVLIANGHEMQRLSELIDIEPSEIKNMVELYITTLGKDGALVEGKGVGGSMKIKAEKVGSVVDPTGAGDAFRAGFFSALIRGYDLELAGAWAAVAAAYAVEVDGAQSFSFTEAEFEERVELYLKKK